MQDILAYITLGIAVGYLIKKYFFKSKSNGSCDTDCGSC